MLSRIIGFLRYDIWRIRLRDLSRLKSFFIRQLRIIVLAVRGFEQDKCKFRASALTFYSLLSIVPVLAMMFGIAKGFGLHSRVEQTLTQRMQEMQIKEEVITRIIDFANSLLQQASGGFIAGIGGSIYAHYTTHIEHLNFSILLATFAIAYPILGGLRTVFGTLIAVLFIQGFLVEGLRFLGDWRNLLFGALIVVAMVVRPRGLIDEQATEMLRRLFDRKQGSSNA